MSSTDATIISDRASIFIPPTDDQYRQGNTLTGIKLVRVRVICTHADLSDAQFRQWLSSVVRPHMIRQGMPITLEVH